MIGYHYTNIAYADSILKHGLKLKEIEGIDELTPHTKGLWLFKKILKGETENAFVIRQMTKFNCDRVVLFKVRYSPADMRIDGYQEIKGTHRVEVEDRIYFNECTLLGKPVSASRIKLLGTHSLSFKRAWQRKKKKQSTSTSGAARTSSLAGSTSTAT